MKLFVISLIFGKIKTYKIFNLLQYIDYVSTIFIYTRNVLNVATLNYIYLGISQEGIIRSEVAKNLIKRSLPFSHTDL